MTDFHMQVFAEKLENFFFFLRIDAKQGLASLDVPPAQTSEGSIRTAIPSQFFARRISFMHTRFASKYKD